jgi:hypothetical protein
MKTLVGAHSGAAGISGGEDVNLLARKNGAQVLAVSSEAWLKTISGDESRANIGSFLSTPIAVFAFRLNSNKGTKHEVGFYRRASSVDALIPALLPERNLDWRFRRSVGSDFG